MKNYFFIAFLLACLANSATAQMVTIMNWSSGKPIANSRYAEIVGSAFLDDEFLPGRITLKDGTKAEVNLRFNAYNNTLEVEKDKEAYSVSSAAVAQFTTTQGGDTILFQNNFSGISGGTDTTFYIVRYFNENATYLERYAREIKTRDAEFNSASKGKYFAIKRTFYIGTTENGFKFVRKKRNSVLKAFPEKYASDLKSYAKSNNLKCKKHSDIIKILNFYSELLKTEK